MALEFTTIPDREGPAVYLLGHTGCEDQLKQLGTTIDSLTGSTIQTAYLDINSGNGTEVAEFYGYVQEQLPVILIVQDDDTVYQSWHGMDLPAADVVAHYLNELTGSSGA